MADRVPRGSPRCVVNASRICGLFHDAARISARSFAICSETRPGSPRNSVRRLEDGGCAAVVLHSLFEEPILAGADAVQLASALLRHGPAYTGTMLRARAVDGVESPLRGLTK